MSTRKKDGKPKAGSGKASSGGGGGRPRGARDTRSDRGAGSGRGAGKAPVRRGAAGGAGDRRPSKKVAGTAASAAGATDTGAESDELDPRVEDDFVARSFDLNRIPRYKKTAEAEKAAEEGAESSAEAEGDELDDEFEAGEFSEDDAQFVDGDGAAAEPGSAPRFAHRPLIALVGRPNVGKSRLFNRMTGTRHAIVEDMPGVTRDRQYGEGVWNQRAFQVVDTGGFEPETTDVLLSQMKEQAQLAMEQADIIVFVMDGRTGLMPADWEIARLLRQSDRVVIPIVNKIDGHQQEALVGDFYSLGFEDIVAISAEHGKDFDLLMDRIEPWLPRVVDVEAREDGAIRVAVIGRPNAGKSTLVNRLLGEDRLLTSDIPGTTRDAINTWHSAGDKEYLFIDTAGVRRKRSISETVEKYSVVHAFKAIDRADVVLIVLDATAGVTTQDQRICGMAHEKGRAALLLLNKWDIVEKDHKTADMMIERIRDELKFNRYAPVVTISAKTGQRIHRILPVVDELHHQYTRRISTAKLNNVIREALAKNPPMPKGGRRFKVFYASQVSASPPTFMLSVNHKDLMHFSYERYLRNMLRKEFEFEGSPIKIFLRERKQKDRDTGALHD